jgi:hypothetical protein
LDISLNDQTNQIANIISNAPPQVQNELSTDAEQIQQSYDQRMTQLAQAANPNFNNQYGNTQGYNNQYGSTQGYNNQYGGNNNFGMFCFFLLI